MKDIRLIRELLQTAIQWQANNNRNLCSLVDRVEEEVGEFKELAPSGPYYRMLDEVGDILVNASRIVARLTPIEREFVDKVTKMKAQRRLVDPGVKDKVIEDQYARNLYKSLFGEVTGVS